MATKLTRKQFNLLTILVEANSPMSQRKLADTSGHSLSSVNRTLQELIANTPAEKLHAYTTAAGDTFTAALAHFYLQGMDIQNATHLAHCAAAISVSRVGAYTSIPTKAEVLAFAEAHPRR